MKPKFLLALIFPVISFSSYGQYCTPSPAINTGGSYFTAIQYGLAGFTYGITGGVSNFSASTGYTDYTSSSSGTINRNCSVGFPVNVYNPNGTATPLNIRLFVDWNSDSDFDDAGELVWDFDWSSLGAMTSLGTGASFIVPPNAPSVVRLRFVLREGFTKATACGGGFWGETEDYQFIVNPNVAPDISTAIPFINPLNESQINNEGVLLHEVLNSAVPGADIFTDADACKSPGVAITAVNAPNGQWQYKIPSGTWTDFGSVDITNALLLSGQQNAKVRIRFVPTGPGTSTFTFKSWDQYTGANATYANTTSSGGTTAFSTSTKTASLVTYSNAASAGDVSIYMGTTSDGSNNYNMNAGALDKVAGTIKLPGNITTDALSGFTYDLDIDEVNNKLVWTGGADGLSLLRSNLDGTGLETLQSGVFGYPTGVAAGGGKIFVADYGILYSLDGDGTNMSIIDNNTGSTADVEFANNKIYYVTQPSYTGNFLIISANPDGSSATQIYSTTGSINGLFVTGNAIYWTEMDGSSNASVKTKSLAGGPVTDLVTEAGQFYWDIQADEQHSLIYIVSQGLPSDVYYRIKTIPISGGAATRILDLESAAGSIVFQKNLSTLPVYFISVKAAREDKNINVSWNVAQEEGLREYAVERSGNGTNFVKIATVAPGQANRYNWTDQQPLAGTNYYRIRAVNLDGTGQYSSIVKVDPANAQSGIAIYPTLATGNNIFVKLDNMAAGNYGLVVFNTSGQVVFNTTISHGGGSSVASVNLPAALAKGMYRVNLTNATSKKQTTIVIP